MNKKTAHEWRMITKKASSTFYLATLLFPAQVRDDVFALYAYLRTADDFADLFPSPDTQRLMSFFSNTEKCLLKGTCYDPLITDFAMLSKKYAFDKQWLDSFMRSLTWDIEGKTYITFSDLESYIYGVADIVGLYLARIVNLPARSYKAAQLTGKGMQLINIIRDIQEDYNHNRIYIPQEDLKNFGIQNIVRWQTNPKQYQKFITFQIDRALSIITQAKGELVHVPIKNRGALLAAVSLYTQLALKMKKDPLSIYKKRVALSRFRIIGTVLIAFLTTLWSKK